MVLGMPDVIVVSLGRPRLRLMSWFLRDAGIDTADDEGYDMDGLATLTATSPLVVLNTVAPAGEITSFVRELRAALPQARVAAMHPRTRDDVHADLGADICIYHTRDVDRVVEAVLQCLAAERP